MIFKSLSVVLVFLTFHSIIECHQNHHQDQQFYQQQQHQQQPHQQQQQHHQQPNQQQQQQQHHNGHGGTDQIMNNINKDHVLEHLDGVINKPKDQMTIEEQNFYYFKLHDYDNNNMLDGLELVSAFAHNDEHKDEHADSNSNNNTNGGSAQPAHPRISDDELTKLIDEIMKDEDKNQDGYITYQEFLRAIKG